MEHLSNYEKDIRPWGEFERFTLNEKTTVKIIRVKAGESFSLQTHTKREEFWRVLSGKGRVTIGSEDREANGGSEFYIKQGEIHRAHAMESDLVFLEIAFGEFEEDDIVRLEDNYGRA